MELVSALEVSALLSFELSFDEVSSLLSGASLDVSDGAGVTIAIGLVDAVVTSVCDEPLFTCETLPLISAPFIEKPNSERKLAPIDLKVRYH